MKIKLLTILFLGWFEQLMAQSVQRVEYFIDNDPNFGNGINVPITAGSTVTANLNIPLSASLSDGFHKFYIRAKDATGKWSIVHSQTSLSWEATGSIQNITKLEYFIDTDAGFGLAENITFTAGTNVTKDLVIPLPANLPLGFHKFYIRAKDAAGKWSVIFNQNFFKTNELPSLQNITKLEYFIDTDAGFGSAINLPITASTNVTKDLIIPLPANLSLGFHKFYIRAKDAAGKWSVVFNQNFFKTNELPTLQNITKVEYFVDTDPGFGLATNLPITANTTINLNDVVYNLPNNTSLGSHQLVVRAKDAAGKWSVVGIKGFTNCAGVSIAAPQGSTSCSDSIRLVAQLQNPELGGSLKWFRNGTALNIINDTLFAINSGTYRVERSTAGCLNIPSVNVDVNILSSTSIALKTDKARMYCNEQVVVSIDTAQSILPKGIPVLFDWFRDNTNIAINSGSAFQTTTLAGTFKARMKVSLFPSGCQTFDSDSIKIENQNLTLNITPQTGTNALLLCTGSVATLVANQNLGENISYQWFKDGQALANQTSNQISINNAAGTYVVKGSFLGCQNIASASLVVSYAGNSNEVPTISAVQNLNVAYCGGEVLNLNATGCSNGVLWSFGGTGNNVDFSVNRNTTITASCAGSCLGSASNTLNVLGNGFIGLAASISYALLPCSPDYTNIFRTDRVVTYSGVEVIQWKDFSGGGSLLGGNYTSSLFENINSSFGPKGGKDFVLREKKYGGAYPFLFGGTGEDILAGFEEIRKSKYLVYGTTNSPNDGNITTNTFGQNDFLAFQMELPK